MECLDEVVPVCSPGLEHTFDGYLDVYTCEYEYDTTWQVNVGLLPVVCALISRAQILCCQMPFAIATIANFIDDLQQSRPKLPWARHPNLKTSASQRLLRLSPETSIILRSCCFAAVQEEGD